MKIPVHVAMLASACLLAPAIAAAELRFNECGGTVPPNETAVLDADVVCQYRCSNHPESPCGYDQPIGEPARCGDVKCHAQRFELSSGSRLDLNGHTITFAYQASAVACVDAADNTCFVVGPGTILGGKGTGISGRSMNVDVENLSIVFTDASIATQGRLDARKLRIRADRENDLFAEKGLRLTNSDFDAGAGSPGTVVLERVRLGPHARIAGDVVRGHHVRMFGVATVIAAKINLSRVVALPDRRNGETGGLLSSEGELRLSRSRVDLIESGALPVLDRSTCTASSVFGEAGTWGVCSDD